MKTIMLSLSWCDDDMTPESLKMLADESAVSMGWVVQRAIAEYIDRYLEPSLEETKPSSSLRELFVQRGILRK